MIKSVTDALESVYSVTDCRNGVFGWAAPSTGKRFLVEAEKLGLLRSEAVEMCDDDGFAEQPTRHRTGYQLTNAGYEALTSFQPQGYPVSQRRLWDAQCAKKEVE